MAENPIIGGWESLARSRPLNERRVETYARLLEAQDRIAREREKRGTPMSLIERALDLSESPHPERESDRQLYLGTLRRYVEALEGALQEEPGVEAVFAEGNIELPSAPTDPHAGGFHGDFGE